MDLSGSQFCPASSRNICIAQPLGLLTVLCASISFQPGMCWRGSPRHRSCQSLCFQPGKLMNLIKCPLEVSRGGRNWSKQQSDRKLEAMCHTPSKAPTKTASWMSRYPKDLKENPRSLENHFLTGRRTVSSRKGDVGSSLPSSS